MKMPTLTIIDDKNTRGVLGPRKFVSKEVLEDMIDMVELSTPEAARAVEKRIREADKKNDWIPLENIRSELQKAKK